MQIGLLLTASYYRGGMGRATMLYDFECGLCLRAAAWARVARLDVVIRPLQSVDLVALGVSPDRAVRELPLVTGDGKVYYGHRAVAAALRAGPPVFRAAGYLMMLPGVRTLAQHTYAWVSRNR